MPEEQEKQEKTAEELHAEKQQRGDFVEETTDGVQASEEESTDAPEEEEAESEETVEVEAAAEEEEPEEEEDQPGAKTDDPIMIPKSRFDEAQQKARDREAELQRRLDAAEERKAKETTSESVNELEAELDKLDRQFAQLLVEGEVEKAEETRAEWRRKQNDLIDIRLEQRSTLASRQAIEGMRFDRQLAEYEVQYPVINPDSEEFNQDVANEVRDLMDAFEAKGWNPVAALNKAVKYAVPKGEDVTKGVDPDVKRTQRKVAARKKVAKVAEQSPPDITDKGRDTDKIGTGDGLPDVTRMSPEQFAELSENQLRKLRGDTLTEQELSS